MSSLEAFRNIVRQLKFEDDEPQSNQTTHEFYDNNLTTLNSDLKQSGSNIESKGIKKSNYEEVKAFDMLKQQYNNLETKRTNYSSLFINTADIENDNSTRML